MRGQQKRLLLLMFEYNTTMALEQRTDGTTRQRAEMARALASSGFGDVHVVDRVVAAKLLTEKRQELIARVADGGIDSVRGLAGDLDRDVAAVSRDLDLLFTHDVIEYDTDGQRKIPRLKHDAVVAEPLA